MLLTKDDIKKQSVNAWKAWKSRWLDNCEINKSLKRIPVKNLVNELQSDVLVQCAFGYSLSRHLDIIKEYRETIKVMCCDKAYGYLMDNDISPDYCILADANVSSDWINGHDTSNTHLISNIAGNTDWTTKWKGKLSFYVNWDNIGSAKVLGRAGNTYEVIPASSNVSNAQVIFAAQVLNPKVQLLTGYDYSWMDGGNYYASDDSPKRYYMHHIDAITPYGYIAQTSTNLDFSRKWLMQFLSKFPKTRVVNCSEMGLLDLPEKKPLRAAIKRYTFN